MRTSIQQAIAGAAIGMGIAMVIGFVKFLLADKFYLSNDTLPLRFGVTAIIMAILMGIVGGIIGLIVGAFGLRTYQGASFGLLFAALGWRLVYESIHNLVSTIISGRVNPRPIWDDILILSMFLDFVIVGALVSLFIRRLFAR